MREIQRADPGAQRRASLLVCCGILTGLVVIWLAESYGPAINAWITRNPEQIYSRLALVFAIVALAVAVPIMAFAGYLWRLGKRIIRSQRFPPPGTFVARDTIVLRDAAARRRGRLLQILAVFMVAAVLGFVAILWRLLSLLGL
jgi:hypothetical protein